MSPRWQMGSSDTEDPRWSWSLIRFSERLALRNGGSSWFFFPFFFAVTVYLMGRHLTEFASVLEIWDPYFEDSWTYSDLNLWRELLRKVRVTNCECLGGVKCGCVFRYCKRSLTLNATILRSVFGNSNCQISQKLGGCCLLQFCHYCSFENFISSYYRGTFFLSKALCT